LILVAGLAYGAWWWWKEQQKLATSPGPVRAPVPAASGTQPATLQPIPVMRAFRSNGVVVIVTNAFIPVPAPQRPASSSVPKNDVAPLLQPEPAVRTVATNPAPSLIPGGIRWTGFRPVQNAFEAQLALARRGISPGSIDGVSGGQTRAALLAFQRQQGLSLTGELDAPTRARLLVREPLYTVWTVQAGDLADLQPISKTWLGKSQQTSMAYETLLEKVAEKAWSSPTLVRRLNPAINWDNVAPGTPLMIPAVEPPPVSGRAAVIRIELGVRALEVFDDYGRLVAHFPCSIAARVDKRPVGELHVAVAIPNPNYTMNPEVFPESPEAQQLGRKLIIPPGPNNPVGLAWIGLDRPGYGIHGTPSPEQVGRTESHGCFRLANWNAQHLLRVVGIETPVQVVP
jgi:lipoprotein-anchoring transpeptidase ErfK/SrfK